MNADLEAVASAAATLRRNDEESFRVAVTTYFELGMVCARVMRDHDLGQRELARKVGLDRISQSSIARALTNSERDTPSRLARHMRSGNCGIQGYVDALRAGRL